MNGVSLQPAYVLHHRPFRDSSVIAELLTPSHGRQSVIARGVRSEKSRRRALLQPFRPLLASWVGRSELRALTSVEESGLPLRLTGESLGCAYYITELALHLVAPGEPNPTAFALYQETLDALSAGQDRESALRRFELLLLDGIGVLPELGYCTVDRNPVQADRLYRFDATSGVLAVGQHHTAEGILVSGSTLLALAQFDVSASETRREEKPLMRSLVDVQLGGRELRSRRVYTQLHRWQRVSDD